jgi:hypothetical protein
MIISPWGHIQSNQSIMDSENKMPLGKAVACIAAAIVVLVIAAHLLYPVYLRNRPVPGVPPELINTEAEAIEYARQDGEFMAQAGNLSLRFDVEYSARWYEKKKRWSVSVYAADVTDVGYGMGVYPNGTITGRGVWMI